MYQYIFRWIKSQIRSFNRRRKRKGKRRKSKAIGTTAAQEENGVIIEEADEGKIS